MAEKYVFHGPGREPYEAWRRTMNKAHRRRGHTGREPRWKDLRPWVMQVWNDAADGRGIPRYEAVQLPCPHTVPCVDPEGCQPPVYRKVN